MNQLPVVPYPPQTHFDAAWWEMWEQFMHAPANRKTLNDLAWVGTGVGMGADAGVYTEPEYLLLKDQLNYYVNECQVKLGLTDD